MTDQFSKAKKSLDNIGYKKRLAGVADLVKNTLSIIGRDKDIVTPWRRMVIYNMFMVILFFYAILAFYQGWSFGGLALFISILLFLYKHFYNNKQEMRQSWIVYEVICGRDPSYKDGVKASKEVKSGIRKVAWLDILMIFVQKAKYVGGGFMMFLLRMFAKGIEEAWDLVNHYMLPSIAIDKLNIRDGISEMKKLKDRVPKTLAGVFGIDSSVILC